MKMWRNNQPTHNTEKKNLYDLCQTTAQPSQYYASLDKIVDLYNKLPEHIKLMTMGHFKKYLNQYQIKTG